MKMNMTSNMKRCILVSLVVVLVVAGIGFATGLQPVQAEEDNGVEIRVDNEDPGEELTLYMEPEEEVKADFSFVRREEFEIDEVKWIVDGDLESNDHQTIIDFEEEDEYEVELEIESVEGDQYSDQVTVDVKEDDRGMFLATIGAGLAVGIAGMGAGIGVGIAGAAGAGTIAEKPDKFGLSLVFQALPQTQAIYGLLVAILLFLFTGVIGDPGYVSVPIGIMAIGIGLAVGLAGLSAVGQGISSASGIAAVSEDSDMFGKGMVFSVLPETQAIYGLLISILLMIFSGLLNGGGEGLTEPVAIVGVGAGLAVGIAGLSGIGQGIAAGSGVATVAEDDTMFGRGMVFSVLPETQAIYGLLIAILLIVFSGMMNGDGETMTMGMSIAAVGAGLAIGIAGLSGIGQGITSGSAIAAVSNREETFGKGMIFSVMSETFAIFGLLIAILIIVSLGFM